MLTTPVRLNECSDILILDDDPKDRYTIAIEPGTHLVIAAGEHAGSPAAAFSHPAMAARVKQIHDFKHYLRNGGKRWTQRAGITYYFVIPRTAVTLLPKKGYSYIAATINDVPVTFSVSGGSGNGGWADWLRTYTHIGVGHPIRDLKRFAAVAVRDTDMEPLPVNPMDPKREEEWARLAAKACATLKHRLYFLIASGQEPIVHLVQRYHFQECRSGPALSMEYGWRKPKRPTGLILELAGAKVLASLSQIDWYATAQANDLALEKALPIPEEPAPCAATP